MRKGEHVPLLKRSNYDLTHGPLKKPEKLPIDYAWGEK